MTLVAHDPWTRRLARLDPRLDRHMGETVRVEPMVDGDFTVMADPARAAFDVVGVLSITRGENDIGGNAATLRNMQIRTQPTELAIARAKLDAVAPGFAFRKGDRVVARATGSAFAVERVDREHEGRLVMTLVTVAGDA